MPRCRKSSPSSMLQTARPALRSLWTESTKRANSTSSVSTLERQRQHRPTGLRLPPPRRCCLFRLALACTAWSPWTRPAPLCFARVQSPPAWPTVITGVADYVRWCLWLRLVWEQQKRVLHQDEHGEISRPEDGGLRFALRRNHGHAAGKPAVLDHTRVPSVDWRAGGVEKLP